MNLTSFLFGLLQFIPKLLAKSRHHYRRPQLRLYLRHETAYLTRPVIEEGNTPGYFCHLLVANDGKELARNCRARVIDISVPNSACCGSTTHPMFLNPFVLKWAHENNYNPQDIEFDLPKRLDLCYGLQANKNRLFFFTPQKPDGNLKIYPPGVYQVKIRVDAENAKSVDKTFQVDFKGGWNQIEIYEIDQ